MKMKNVSIFFLFLAAVTQLPAGEAPIAHVPDPAAPVLSPELPQKEPLQATKNDDVIIHAKPKPLHKEAVTHDWISFLGPTLNAVSTETKLLKPFPTAGPTLLWEMKKGGGYSSPAILKDRLVYLHRVGDNEVVECLHAESGDRYWKFGYPTTYKDRYGYNNGPRASPVIDSGRVYTFGAQGMLHCFSLQSGHLFWKRDLQTEFKVPQDFFGISATPLIEGELLIISIGAPAGPAVIALDKNSGKLVWSSGDTWGPGYGSPVAATIHGKRRVLVFAGGDSRPPTGGLLCIDPANGKLDFRAPWRSATYESVNAATPVVIGNQVFVSASYNTGGTLITIKPDFTHEVAWTSEDLGTHWNTAIHKDGYLYGFDGRHMEGAAVVCLEVKTGKQMWRQVPEWNDVVKSQRGDQTRKHSTFRGTFLWADGKFLCLGEIGHLLWLDLTPEGGYKELSRAWLFASQDTWSVPVLSRGLLYVNQNHADAINKTQPRLLCYDLRAAE